MPTAHWKSYGIWLQTKWSWNLDSLWPWGNYFTFLTFNFLKTKTRTLRTTLQVVETSMLPLTHQHLPIFPFAWNILLPNIFSDHESAQLSLIDKRPVRNHLIPRVLPPHQLFSLPFSEYWALSTLFYCYVPFLSMLPNCELVEFSRLYFIDRHSKNFQK